MPQGAIKGFKKEKKQAPKKKLGKLIQINLSNDKQKGRRKGRYFSRN